MSDRTLFWLGTVMLALALGLLVGGVVLPRPTHAQQLHHFGEGRSAKYVLVTGVEGNARQTQTIYLTDNANDILYIFEYCSTAKRYELRNIYDVRHFSSALISKRGKREDREK
jgi:hypothetical protein